MALGDLDVDFRPMQDGDIDAGLRLCRLSGWDQVAHDWQRFFESDPAAAIAAVCNGRLVGTVAAIRYGAQFGWIGMVLVDHEVQGRGVGAALVTRALDLLSDLPARLDATPAGEPLYLKQGFVQEYRLQRMRATTLRSTERPLRAARPMTRDDLSEVMTIDGPVFGAPRAALLDWMYTGAPEHAWVTEQDGRIVGYMFGRHGYEFEHLGPIVGPDLSVAIGLTTACLERHSGKAFIIDARCDAEEWIRFLEGAGFYEERPYIRMHRGGSPPFGLPQRQFAVLGPEFG